MDELLLLFAEPPKPPTVINPPGDDLSNADPDLADAVRRVHARIPVHMRDVYRPRSDQQLFFDCMNIRRSTGRCPPGPCQRSGCASANKPGESRHEATYPDGKPRAEAVDMHPINGDWSRFRSICYQEGLHDPIGDEDWHWQLKKHRSSVLGQP